MSDEITVIRKAVADNKAIIGTKRALKAVKNNEAAQVYVTANAPSEVSETLEQYCSMQDIPYLRITQTNEELGLTCKKPYLISVLAVAK